MRIVSWNCNGALRRKLDKLTALNADVQEAHGGEVQPTFFMHRKIEKPYHIDYAFASGDLTASARISVGRPEDWLDLSDHMPIVVDFALA